MEERDAMLLTGGRDCLLRLWNPRTSEQVAHSMANNGWIFSIVGIGENSVASTGYDETIHLFDLPRKLVSCDLSSGEDEEESDDEEEEEGEGEMDITFDEIQSFQGHTNTVRCLTSFPWHQIIVSGADDHQVKVWNLKKQKCSKTIKKMHRDSVKDVCCVGRNCFVSGSDDQTVLKWSLKKLRKPIRSLSLTSFISNILHHPTRDLIFVSMCNVVGILDQNLKIISKIVHDRPVTSLAFDEEHDVLITGDRKGFINMFDLRRPEINAFQNKCHSDYLTGIEILNNEEYITTSLQRPNSLKYWKFNQKKCTKSVSINCDGVWSMCYLGEKLQKEISDQMIRDVEERITFLIESGESDEEDDNIIISDRMKLQLYHKHMFLSKVFLLF